MYFSAERNKRVAEKLFGYVRDTATDQVEEILEYDLSIYSCPDVAKQERNKSLSAFR